MNTSNKSWLAHQQEIKLLLDKLMDKNRNRLPLPKISDQAAKQIARHIQAMLKKDLH